MEAYKELLESGQEELLRGVAIAISEQYQQERKVDKETGVVGNYTEILLQELRELLDASGKHLRIEIVGKTPEEMFLQAKIRGRILQRKHEKRGRKTRDADMKLTTIDSEDITRELHKLETKERGAVLANISRENTNVIRSFKRTLEQRKRGGERIGESRLRELDDRIHYIHEFVNELMKGAPKKST